MFLPGGFDAEFPDKKSSGDESAEMGPPGDTAGDFGVQERADALEELQDEPEEEEDEGGDRDDWREPERDESEDDRGREEQEIGTEESGDGSAGSDHRNRGEWAGGELGQGRAESGNEVEEEVAERAGSVFHHAAEDPEKPEIREKMKPAAVEKHGGEERERLFGRGIGDDGGGGEGVAGDEFRELALLEKQNFPDEEADVGEDQEEGDGRESAAFVVIEKREHGERIAGLLTGDCRPLKWRA